MPLSRASHAGIGRAVLVATALQVAFGPLTGGLARAAEQPASEPPAAAAPAPAPDQDAAETPATVIDNKQIESILGRPVLSPTGEDMGRIVDILADKKGQLRAAVIDFGGFFGVGSRKIAVDWHALHLKNDGKSDTIVADLPRNQLKTAPVYKDGEPVVVLGRATETKAADPAPAPPPPAAPPPAPAPAAAPLATPAPAPAAP